jgi:hypothetical protein
MIRVVFRFVMLCLCCTGLWAQGNAARTTHTAFQATDAHGFSTFIHSGAVCVSLEGILLNCPEQWVDPTPNSAVGPWQMGGQWEIFVQGERDDHAGTACWMGQNYGNGPGYDNYTNDQWLEEITRLNHDPATGYVFRPGDRVRATGRFLFYAGKLNINENHEVGSEYDFSLELVKPAVGLPQPEPVRLSDLLDEHNEPIFDPDRLCGPEFYQARLVRIEGVTILNPENWGGNSDILIMDANGLTFPVHLCLGAGLSRHPCPAGQIDVVGIMDQKSPGYPPDLTRGYRVLVLDYDGNGLVLGTLTTQRGNLPGDVNHDYRVDEADRTLLETNMNQAVPGLVE